LRAHPVGVPAARRGKRRRRLEAPADAGARATRGRARARQPLKPGIKLHIPSRRGTPLTTTAAVSELHFDPPGPGSWELDPIHFPRPATRYWTEMHPEPFRRGFSEFTKYYGMLIDTLDMAYVNGFAYRTTVPVAESEVPERFRRAEEVFEGKLWRDQLRDWDSTFKPASVA